MKFSLWFRGIALMTLTFFTSTSLVQADMIRTITSGSPRAESTTAYIQNSIQSVLESINLPESIGQIKQTYQGSGDGLVIHIQDAHANEEAQRNIAGILEYFADEYGLSLVNVEGAQGELLTPLFSLSPDHKVTRVLADYFLREARLSGSEYAALVKRPDLLLYGVEDREIYEKNRQAYLQAVTTQERDEKILAGLEKALTDVSRFIFTEELRELARRRASFQEGSHELVRYVQYLVEAAQKHQVSLFEYPGLHSLLELVELEKQIRFEDAEKEIESLSSDLKKVISKERLSDFLSNTVQFRMKKMNRSDYYGFLEQEIKTAPKNTQAAEGEEASLERKYENVLKYLRYVRLYDSIKIDLFDEIDAIEKTVKDKLFTNQEQVSLDRVTRIFEIFQKLFNFTLTKQDADFFYTYRSEFNAQTFRGFLEPLMTKHQFGYALPADLEVLEQDLKGVEAFYSAAIQRDRVMIEKTVQKIQKGNHKISAIVTGGFHTPGIEKYLREHQQSYIVVMPRISKKMDAKKESRLYQESLEQKPLALEQRLVEAYFPPKSAQLQDPRFQLAAWHMILSAEDPKTPGFIQALGEGKALSWITQNPELRPAFVWLSTDIALALSRAKDPEALRAAWKETIKGTEVLAPYRDVLTQRIDNLTGVLEKEKGERPNIYFWQKVDSRTLRLYAVVSDLTRTGELRDQLSDVNQTESLPLSSDGNVRLYVLTVDQDRVLNAEVLKKLKGLASGRIEVVAKEIGKPAPLKTKTRTQGPLAKKPAPKAVFVPSIPVPQPAASVTVRSEQRDEKPEETLKDEETAERFNLRNFIQDWIVEGALTAMFTPVVLLAMGKSFALGTGIFVLGVFIVSLAVIARDPKPVKRRDVREVPADKKPELAAAEKPAISETQTVVLQAASRLEGALEQAKKQMRELLDKIEAGINQQMIGFETVPKENPAAAREILAGMEFLLSEAEDAFNAIKDQGVLWTDDSQEEKKPETVFLGGDSLSIVWADYQPRVDALRAKIKEAEKTIPEVSAPTALAAAPVSALDIVEVILPAAAVIEETIEETASAVEAVSVPDENILEQALIAMYADPAVRINDRGESDQRDDELRQLREELARLAEELRLSAARFMMVNQLLLISDFAQSELKEAFQAKMLAAQQAWQLEKNEIMKQMDALLKRLTLEAGLTEALLDESLAGRRASLEIETLRQKISALGATVEAQALETVEVKGNYDALREQHQTLQTLFTALQSERDSIQAQLDQTLESKKTGGAELKEKLTAAEKLLARVEGELSRAIDSMRQRYRAVQDQLEIEMGNQANTIRELEARLASQEDFQAQLQSERANLENIRQQADSASRLSEQKIEALSRRNNLLESQASARDLRITELEGEKANLSRERDELAGKLEDLAVRLQAAQTPVIEVKAPEVDIQNRPEYQALQSRLEAVEQAAQENQVKLITAHQEEIRVRDEQMRVLGERRAAYESAFVSSEASRLETLQLYTNAMQLLESQQAQSREAVKKLEAEMAFQAERADIARQRVRSLATALRNERARGEINTGVIRRLEDQQATAARTVQELESETAFQTERADIARQRVRDLTAAVRTEQKRGETERERSAAEISGLRKELEIALFERAGAQRALVRKEGEWKAFQTDQQAQNQAKTEEFNRQSEDLQRQLSEAQGAFALAERMVQRLSMRLERELQYIEMLNNRNAESNEVIRQQQEDLKTARKTEKRLREQLRKTQQRLAEEIASNRTLAEKQRELRKQAGEKPEQTAEPQWLVVTDEKKVLDLQREIADLQAEHRKAINALMNYLDVREASERERSRASAAREAELQRVLNEKQIELDVLSREMESLSARSSRALEKSAGEKAEADQKMTELQSKKNQTEDALKKDKEALTLEQLARADEEENLGYLLTAQEAELELLQISLDELSETQAKLTIAEAENLSLRGELEAERRKNENLEVMLTQIRAAAEQLGAQVAYWQIESEQADRVVGELQARAAASDLKIEGMELALEQAIDRRQQVQSNFRAFQARAQEVVGILKADRTKLVNENAELKQQIQGKSNGPLFGEEAPQLIETIADAVALIGTHPEVDPEVAAQYAEVFEILGMKIAQGSVRSEVRNEMQEALAKLKAAREKARLKAEAAAAASAQLASVPAPVVSAPASAAPMPVSAPAPAVPEVKETKPAISTPAPAAEAPAVSENKVPLAAPVSVPTEAGKPEQTLAVEAPQAVIPESVPAAVSDLQGGQSLDVKQIQVLIRNVFVQLENEEKQLGKDSVWYLSVSNELGKQGIQGREKLFAQYQKGVPTHVLKVKNLRMKFKALNKFMWDRKFQLSGKNREILEKFEAKLKNLESQLPYIERALQQILDSRSLRQKAAAFFRLKEETLEETESALETPEAAMSALGLPLSMDDLAALSETAPALKLKKEEDSKEDAEEDEEEDHAENRFASLSRRGAIAAGFVGLGVAAVELGPAVAAKVRDMMEEETSAPVPNLPRNVQTQIPAGAQTQQQPVNQIPVNPQAPAPSAQPRPSDMRGLVPVEPPVAQQAPAQAPNQAAPADPQRKEGSTLLSGPGSVDRREFHKIDQSGKEYRIPHVADSAMPGLEAQIFNLTQQIAQMPAGRDLDKKKDEKRKLETTLKAFRLKPLTQKILQIEKQITEPVWRKNDMPDELDALRLVTEALGFDLPEKGWLDEWNKKPDADKKKANLTETQRMIVEGKLYTLEDWAERYMIPLMMQMGLLDQLRKDYQPEPLNISVEDRKARERKSKARLNFITQFARGIIKVKEQFIGKFDTGVSMDRYELMFQSLRFHSDDEAMNHSSWQALGVQHGDFLLNEIIGLGFDEAVANSMNHWEEKMRLMVQKQTAEFIQSNQYQLLVKEMHTFGKWETIRKNFIDFYLNLRDHLRDRNTYRFMQYGTGPGAAMTDEQLQLRAAAQEGYYREYHLTPWQSFDRMLQSAMNLVVESDLLAARMRYMDPNLDVKSREGLLGDYRIGPDEKNSDLVSLPKNPMDRIHESNLRHLLNGRFPFEEATHGSFRNQNYLDYFSFPDEKIGTIEDAAHVINNAFNLLDTFLKRLDPDLADDNFVGWIAGLSGKARPDGSTPALHLMNQMWRNAEELRSRRSRQSKIEDKTKTLTRVISEEKTKSGKKYPVFSETAMKSFAATLVDFYQSPLAQETVDEEQLTQHFLSLLGEDSYTPLVKTYDDEYRYFLQPRPDLFGENELAKSSAKSILQMMLRGDEIQFFGIDEKNQDMITQNLPAAKKIAADLRKYQNIKKIPAKYQDLLVLFLKLIDEMEDPKQAEAYMAIRRQETLARLRLGAREAPHPADVERELQNESIENRKKKLYGDLIRIVRTMMLDFYKNDRLAMLKKSYDQIHSDLESELSDRGYSLEYSDPSLRNVWARGTKNSLTVVEPEVVRDIREGDGKQPGIVTRVLTQMQNKDKMRAPIRKKLEDLLGVTLNLNDGIFQDPAVLSKLLDNAIDRNMTLPQLERVLTKAIELKNDPTYVKLLEEYIRAVDPGHVFFFDPAKGDSAVWEWNLKRPTLGEVLEKLGYRVAWRLVEDKKNNRKTYVRRYEKKVGNTDKWAMVNSLDEIKRKIAEAKERHKRMVKQAELQLGILLADAESAGREGDEIFFSRFETIVEFLGPQRVPPADAVARLNQALGVTRSYQNSKGKLIYANPIHEDDDNLLSRPRDASVRGFLNSLVKDSLYFIDPIERKKKTLKDFKTESARLQLITEILQDYQKPETQQRYRFEFSDFNSKTGEKLKMHAFDWAIRFAPRFYKSIYPQGEDLKKILPEIDKISNRTYAGNSRVEGMVNGILLFTFSEDNLKVPGDAGYEDWVRKTAEQSFNDTFTIDKWVHLPEANGQLEALGYKDAAELKARYLRMAFEEIWLQEKPWRVMPPDARFSRMTGPIQNTDILRDAQGRVTYINEPGKKIQDLYEKVFLPNLPHVDHWKGHVFSSWTNDFLPMIRRLEELENRREAGEGDGAALNIKPQDFSGLTVNHIAVGQGLAGLVSTDVMDRRIAMGRGILSLLGLRRSEARSENSNLLDRRGFLKTTGAAVGITAGTVGAVDAVNAQAPANPPAAPRIPPRAPETLVDQARALAGTVYQAPRPLPAAKINAEDYQNKIVDRIQPENLGDGRSFKALPYGETGDEGTFELYVEKDGVQPRRISTTAVVSGVRDPKAVLFSIEPKTGNRKAVTFRIEGSEASLYLNPESPFGVRLDFARIQDLAGKEILFPKIRKVIIRENVAGDAQNIQIQILFENQSLTGVVSVDLKPFLESDTRQPAGKTAAVSVKIFPRKNITAAEKQRIVPVTMRTLMARAYDEATKTQAVLNHDEIRLNQKPDPMQADVFQTSEKMSNPEAGFFVFKPLGDTAHPVQEISLERTDQAPEHFVEPFKEYRGYALSILDTSEAQGMEAYYAAEHTLSSENLQGTALNQRAVVVVPSREIVQGEEISMTFSFHEKRQSDGLEKKQMPLRETSLTPDNVQYVLAASADSEMKKRRVAKYANENFREAMTQAQRFYEGLFGREPFENGTLPYLVKNGALQFMDDSSVRDPKARGLLDGFLHGAAAEKIVDDQEAFRSWMRVSEHMIAWLGQDRANHVDALLSGLETFYGERLDLNPTGDVVSTGKIIAWVRFFAEQDNAGRPKRWQDSVARFFDYAQYVRQSRLSQLLYNKPKFLADNPYDEGVVNSWAAFMRKYEPADPVKAKQVLDRAIQILEAAQTHWRKLSEGEVFFFVKYLAEVQRRYNITLPELFRNIKIAEDARRIASGKLTQEFSQLDIPWASEEDKAAILASIVGTPNQPGLEDEGVSSQKAVYLATKYMPSQGYDGDNLVENIKQELFYQAVFMRYHRDDAGAAKRLMEGELGEFVSRAQREGYDMAAIGRVIKYRALFLNYQQDIIQSIAKRGVVKISGEGWPQVTEVSRDELGRAYLVHKEGNNASRKYFFDKQGVASIETPQGPVKLELIEISENEEERKQASETFPNASPGQIEGFIINLLKRTEILREKLTRELGEVEAELRIRHWSEESIREYFNDLLWIQKEQYAGEKKFLDWQVISPAIYEIREKDYLPLNEDERYRARRRFLSTYKQNLLFMNLNSPDSSLDGELLRFVLVAWRAVTGDILPPDRVEIYMKHLTVLETKLKTLGYTPGQIRGKQSQLIEEIAGFRASYAAQFGRYYYDLMKGNGRTFDITPALNANLDKIETTMIPRLVDTVVASDQRREQAHYIAQLYDTPQVVHLANEAKIREVRAVEAAKWQAELNRENPRSLINSNQLYSDIREAAIQKMIEVQKALLGRELTENEIRNIPDLSPDEIGFLMNRMMTEGYSIEEIIQWYVGIKFKVETIYKKSFLGNPEAFLAPDEEGVAGSYTIPISDRVNFPASLKDKVSKEMVQHRRGNLEHELQRFKAGIGKNPLSAVWVPKLEAELAQVEAIDLNQWLIHELSRVDAVLQMARYIQTRFTEVEFVFSDEQAQIMAYNAFMGSIERADIGAWVDTIKEKVNMWVDAVRDIQNLSGVNMPLEEIIYYADQALKLQLADPILEIKIPSRKFEMELNQMLGVQRQDDGTIFSQLDPESRALVEPFIPQIAKAMEQRKLQGAGAFRILLERAVEMRRQVDAMRKEVKNIDVVSNRMAAPEVLYALFSHELTILDYLAYLDNINTDPLTHIGLEKVFGFSPEHIEKKPEYVLNAMFRLRIEERLTEKLSASVIQRWWSPVEKFRDKLYRNENIGNDKLAFIFSAAGTVLLAIFGGLYAHYRRVTTMHPPDNKVGTIRPGLPLGRFKVEKPTPFGYKLFWWGSTALLMLFGSFILLTLNYSFSSALPVFTLANTTLYLLAPIPAFYFLVVIIWGFAKIRGTTHAPEDPAANTQDGKIAEGHRMALIGLAPFRPAGAGVVDGRAGYEVGAVNPLDDVTMQDVIRNSVGILAESDDPNLVYMLVLQIPPRGVKRAGKDLNLKGTDVLTAPEAQLIRQDMEARREKLFRMIDDTINEMVPDPRMNASVRARLHPGIRYSGYPKPEIFYNAGGLRWLYEEGPIVPLDELFGPNAAQMVMNADYTQGTPRTNVDQYVHVAPHARPAGFTPGHYSPVLSEIMDMTAVRPTMAADLGTDWRTRYPSMQTMRDQSVELKRRFYAGLEAEARQVRETSNQIQTDGAAMKAAHPEMSKAEIEEALRPRIEAVDRQLRDLQRRGKETLAAIRAGNFDDPLPYMQVIDAGLQTEHKQMATLVRAMAESPAIMFQSAISYRPDSIYKTLYAMNLKDFPQETLWFSQEAMQTIFKDKKLGWRKYLFAGIFLLSIYFGISLGGFYGAVIAVVANYWGWVFYHVGNHKGDKPGKIRAFGKYSFKTMLYYLYMVRPWVGAPGGQPRMEGDDYGNLIRKLHTVPFAIGAALSEDEFNSALMEELDYGVQLVPQAKLYEDPMFNIIAEWTRMAAKWTLTFDMGSIMNTRLLPSIKDRPFFTTVTFGAVVGGILSLFVAGLVMPSAALFFMLSALSIYVGAVLVTAYLIPSTRLIRFVEGVGSLALMGGLIYGAVTFGSLHIAVVTAVIFMTGAVYLPISKRLRELQASGALHLTELGAAGRFFNNLVIRGNIAETIWALQLFVTMKAMLEPGLIEVLYPFLGEIIFSQIMLLLVHPKILIAAFVIIEKTIKGLNRDMQKFKNWVKDGDSWNPMTFLMFVSGASVLFPVLIAEYLLRGVFEFLTSTAIYLGFIVLKPVLLVIAFFRFFVANNLYGTGIVTKGSLTDKFFSKLWEVLEWGNPSGLDWLIAGIAEENSSFLHYLWRFKLPLSLGIPVLMMVLAPIVPASVITGLAFSFMGFWLVYGFYNHYVTQKGHPDYVIRGQFVEMAIAVAMVGLAWWSLPAMIQQYPVDLIKRASPIFIVSFVIGPALGWLTGINVIKAKVKDWQGKDKTIGWINPDHWWAEYVTRAISAGLTILALAGAAVLIFSGAAEYVRESLGLIFGMINTGDGQAATPLPLIPGFEKLLSMPWYFALFFNVIIGGTVVMGILAYTLGILSTVFGWIWRVFSPQIQNARNLMSGGDDTGGIRSETRTPSPRRPGGGRSEVRETPADAVIAGIESASSMRQTLDLDLSMLLHGIKGFDEKMTAWAKDEKVITELNAEHPELNLSIAADVQGGYQFVIWDDAQHDREFIEKLTQRTVKVVKTKIFVKPERLEGVKRSLKGMTSLEVVSFGAFENQLKEAKDDLQVQDSQIIELLVKVSDKGTAQLASLGASPLSQGTILILGQHDRRIGQSRVLTIADVIQAIAAVHAAFARSA